MSMKASILDSPIELLCDFLCVSVECRNRKKIDNKTIFCDYLANVYMSSDLTTSCNNFANDARDMVCNEDDSDSPMPVLCYLIIEALDNGTIKYDRKRFFETLHLLYKAYQKNDTTLCHQYRDQARNLIRKHDSYNSSD